MSTFGVDTVSLAFSGLGGSRIPGAFDKATALRHGMGHLLLHQHPSGARVAYYPEPRTLKVECRLSALSTGDRNVKRLGTRTELGHLPDMASELVAQLLGLKVGEVRQERHHLTRLDTTGELRFLDADQGRSMLRATAGLVPGGYKGQPIYRPDGQIETMYVVTAKRGRKVARFYDSGLHHGSAPAGELIRYEVQNRWPKAQRRTPAELAVMPEALPALFARHLEPFTTRAREITVTTAANAPAQIARKLATGELPARKAMALAGFAAILPHGGRHLLNDQAARRYLRELRKAGIVLTGTEQEAALTIGQALDELLRGACEHSEAQ